MTDPVVTAHIRSYSHEGQQHSHDFHQLVLPLTGRLSLAVAREENEVAQQRAAIIPAGEQHGYYARDENRFLVADIPEPLAPALERLPRFVDLSASLLHYVRFMQAQVQSGELSSDTGQQMLLLFARLLQEHYGSAPQPDRRVAVARQYLDDHFRQRITVTQLAAVAHLSPRQLNDLFRQQVGMTPHKYLLKLRMEASRKLLEQTCLSVQQVADAVGYGSLAAFSDRFARYFGISPSYFRRNSKTKRTDTKAAGADLR